MTYLNKNKTKDLNKILVISSDYHILRIKYILETLNRDQNYIFMYDSIGSDYTKWRSVKILVKEVYNKDIVIKESSELKHNRCLRGQIKVPSIREQLEELKEFYGN